MKPVPEDTVQKLKLYFFEVSNKKERYPDVADFRGELVDWLHGKLEDKKTKDFIVRFGKIEIPSQSWFEKKSNLPTWREQWKQSRENPSNMDQPWSLSTLDIYEVRPEAIPFLLQIIDIDLNPEITEKVDGFEPLSLEELPEKNYIAISIREAKWVSRLFDSVPFEYLLNVAQCYSLTEKLYEQAHLKFNSIGYDRLVSRKKYDAFESLFLGIINKLAGENTGNETAEGE